MSDFDPDGGDQCLGQHRSGRGISTCYRDAVPAWVDYRAALDVIDAVVDVFDRLKADA